jgi:hypothetical protein
MGIHMRIHANGPSKPLEQPVFISDGELLRKFVTPQMMRYFCAKMPELATEVLADRICELLKFLILVRFSPGRILFGKQVDDLWHYWILQTRQYAELCDQLPGKSFRHHSSTVYESAAEATRETDQKPEIGVAVQRIISFFISYYRNFGPIVGDRVECWPTLQQVMREAGWDVVGLNDFLREQAAVRAA